jgi:hypothetical protein
MHEQSDAASNSTPKPQRQNDNETENKYNFTQTYPNTRRQRQSCPKHRDQSNKHPRHPKFNWQHFEPIPNTRTPQPIPRAPSKQDEIDEKTKQKQKNKSTNKNSWLKPVLQIQSRPNENVFQVRYRTTKRANQKTTTHRNKIKPPNNTTQKFTNRIDLYSKNHAINETAWDNVNAVNIDDAPRQMSNVHPSVSRHHPHKHKY